MRTKPFTSIEDVLHVLAGNGLTYHQLKDAEEMVAELVLFSQLDSSIAEESEDVSEGKLSFADKVWDMYNSELDI